LVKLNHEEKADVALWLQFLEDFNGQCYFPDKYNAREEGIALEQYANKPMTDSKSLTEIFFEFNIGTI
jgi:hypothetical protein